MPNQLLTSAFGASSTYDEERGNTDTGRVLAVVTTGTTNSADFTNSSCKGLQAFITIATLTGTIPTVTFNLQYKDSFSGSYITILSTVAIPVPGFSRLGVYPGLLAVNNVLANDVLPRTWRIQAVTGGTVTAIDASVSCSLIL